MISRVPSSPNHSVYDSLINNITSQAYTQLHTENQRHYLGAGVRTVPVFYLPNKTNRREIV